MLWKWSSNVGSSRCDIGGNGGDDDDDDDDDEREAGAKKEGHGSRLEGHEGHAFRLEGHERQWAPPIVRCSQVTCH